MKKYKVEFYPKGEKAFEKLDRLQIDNNKKVIIF